ncbi:MAG: PsbP-related protein [Promethearchaeota archaeon]
MQYLLYENVIERIRIKYPKDWAILEGQYGTVVVFIAPKEGPNDLYQENLNIGTRKLRNQIKIENITEVNLIDLKNNIKKFKLIEATSNVRLSDSNAHQIVYEGRHEKYKLKWMQIWTIRDNKLYTLTYTAEKKKYYDFLETILKMIQSFYII